MHNHFPTTINQDEFEPIIQQRFFEVRRTLQQSEFQPQPLAQSVRPFTEQLTPHYQVAKEDPIDYFFEPREFVHTEEDHWKKQLRYLPAVHPESSPPRLPTFECSSYFREDGVLRPRREFWGCQRLLCNSIVSQLHLG